MKYKTTYESPVVRIVFISEENIICASRNPNPGENEGIEYDNWEL